MSQRLYRKCIREWLARATDAEYFEGFHWYDDGRAFCRDLALEFEAPLEVVANVVAALSPRNRWEQNKADARAFVQAYRWYEEVPPSACTFRSNRDAAWRALDGAPISGRKVTSFAANLAGDNDAVTVDTWAVRAATNGALSLVPNDTVYHEVARAYRAVAAEVGLTPCQVQAIVWVTVRNAS